MTCKKILHIFLNYFLNKNHYILPSVPLVRRADPTLMFVNSGMIPLKDYFIGKKKIVFPYTVSIQKCLRVSGKHNDLEDVGKDYYHHTLFEMLGNWSFGYCSKILNIRWAWELITSIYKIPINNIYVTIFAGETKEGISTDEESQFYWEFFLNKKRIINCKKKYNFWEMNYFGPCGSSSEIHVDLRSKREKINFYVKDIINNDHPKLIELWNIVFMEFFRQINGNLEELSQRNVDTGLGFERICRVLQKKDSNYDTDIFSSLLREIENISNLIYGRNVNSDISIRIIVDHIRAIAYAIADGQAPSNTGAGYVIRRLLRRALSYGHYYFNNDTFMHKLGKLFISEKNLNLQDFFSKKKYIEEKILYEELFFIKALRKGIKRLKYIIQYAKNKKQTLISGKKIFELYNSYGIPIYLSRLLIIENDLYLDDVGFKLASNTQKISSRLLHIKQSNYWTFLKRVNGILADRNKSNLFLILHNYIYNIKYIYIYYKIIDSI